MRRIGGDLSRDSAHRFADYMLTRGVHTVVELSGGDDATQFDVWVREEDSLEEARQELAKFRAEPNDPAFDVGNQADELRRKQAKENRQRAKLQRSMQNRSAGGRGFQPRTRVTVTLIIVCIAASILTNFGNLRNREQIRSKSDLPASFRLYDALVMVPATGELENPGPMDYVLRGQVWRLVTPIFLHADPWHLLFNCLFIYFCGRVIEMLFGPPFLLALFFFGGILGNLTQAYGPESLGASPYVIGASGGALALFAFLWLRPMVEPALPFRLSPFNVAFVLAFVVISMLPAAPIGNVANLAHLGGLASGAIVAMGLFDFLRR